MRSRALALLALAVAAPPLVAQNRWLTTVALGTAPRLGTVPPVFTKLNGNWGGHVYSGVRVSPRLFVTVSAGMSLQEFDVRSDTTFFGSYGFRTFMFGAGPVYVARPGERFVVLGAVQPGVAVSFWGASQLGNCGAGCPLNAPTPEDRQVDTRFGVSYSATIAYQVRRRGEAGRDRPYGVGLQLRGIAAPEHRPSGIPVHQLGLYLVLVAGEP